MFAGKVHPIMIARFAVGLLLAAFALLAALGVSIYAAAAFAILFGLTNGLITVARGTVPLTLFGTVGYGRVVGRIASPSLLMQAAAPLVIAFVAERVSDPAALATVAGIAAISFAGFVAMCRPRA
jgi:hypothetical protein